MDWRKELTRNITTVDELKKFIPLSDEEAGQMEAIVQLYPMSISRYYLSLVKPDDPFDPIRKMCIPSLHETNLSGDFDTSGEHQNTIVEGLQHKYPQTALILSTNLCAMYCRHCFRKRLVGQSDDEIVKIFDHIADYIEEHKEITNVLITGGDALLNSNKVIEYYLKRLVKIPHLRLIRIGTRLPVVMPARIYEDQELIDMLHIYSRRKPIYIVTQFNHPRELTLQAERAIDTLIKVGIVVSNQTVLLKGVNNDPAILTELINRLNSVRIIPYYIFQCRPVSSVKTQFQVPLENAYDIIEQTKANLHGHGKRFKFIMSHETGKIEILGPGSDGCMLFKYHQAKCSKDNGRIFSKQLLPGQCWLDDTK